MRRSGAAADAAFDEERRLTMFRRGFEAASLALLAMPAGAAAQEPPPQRTEHVVVYGNDSCPKPADEEEIVVCARRPENERFRIPKPLRDREPSGATSWTARSEELDEASRPSRPGSCSVVGTYGQSGCFQQMINQWFRERRAARSGAAR